MQHTNINIFVLKGIQEQYGWEGVTITFKYNIMQHPLQNCHEENIASHMSKEYEITSWHLISASLCTPMGVCKSETWKLRTSMSDAPNVASTFTFSYMWNWIFLLAMDKRHRKKRSLIIDRARCSIWSEVVSAMGSLDAEIEVVQRAIKRGELGSNPRLLWSGPLGRRSTVIGVFILTFRKSRTDNLAFHLISTISKLPTSTSTST